VDEWPAPDLRARSDDGPPQLPAQMAVRFNGLALGRADSWASWASPPREPSARGIHARPLQAGGISFSPLFLIAFTDTYPHTGHVQAVARRHAWSAPPLKSDSDWIRSIRWIIEAQETKECRESLKRIGLQQAPHR